MKWWGVLLAGCLFGVVWAAETEESTLPYLKNHPEDWPKQVVLKEPVTFKVILDGREAGTMTLPALSTVALAGITDDKVQVSNGTTTSSIPVEQTTLWELVEVIRTERAKRPDPARDDPANSLQLPAHSEPAEWYKKRLQEQIDPWLAKHSGHKLAAAMQERKKNFETELARVVAGDIRRGEKWFTAAEVGPWKTQFAIEDLHRHLTEAAGAKDGSALQALLAEVDRLDKHAAHPGLHRAAVKAIDTLLPSLTEEPLKQALAAWLKKYPRERADAEEKALAQLDEAAKANPAIAARILTEVDKIWPGNERALQLRATTQDALMRDAQSAMAAGNVTEAFKLCLLLDQLSRLPAPASPRQEEIRKWVGSWQPSLARARDTQVAFDQHDFDKVAEFSFKNSPEIFIKWHDGLRSKMTARRDDSNKMISQAEHDLIHLRFSAAQAAFDKAKELWPENPEIPPRERFISGAKWIGILLGVIFGLSLLSYLYHIWDNHRFKRALKRKAEENSQLPREW